MLTDGRICALAVNLDGFRPARTRRPGLRPARCTPQGVSHLSVLSCEYAHHHCIIIHAALVVRMLLQCGLLQLLKCSIPLLDRILHGPAACCLRAKNERNVMPQRFFPCRTHKAAVTHRTVGSSNAGVRYEAHTSIHLQVPQKSDAAIVADISCKGPWNSAALPELERRLLGELVVVLLLLFLLSLQPGCEWIRRFVQHMLSVHQSFHALVYRRVYVCRCICHCPHNFRLASCMIQLSESCVRGTPGLSPLFPLERIDCSHLGCQHLHPLFS
mmetsp:Transcript_14648/g.43677  ORF Transcript_14648/g.43677 Transcript_14648/m.43677 type:complete len:272 (-) Transcript_14648:667-1482(-)